jgi:regulator of sigma E protease
MFDFILANDLLSAIVAFILVLIPAVIIHELGHFLAAKAVGITILEFGVGMPPRAVRLFRAGGTDYTLNWLPLGGFVRPLGEDVVRQHGDEEIETDRDEARARGIVNPKSVYEVSPWRRIVFMAAGAFANFLMAIVLLVCVALLGLPEIVGARAALVYVAPESALAEAGLQSGDVVETVNGETFTSSADFAQSLYNADEPLTLTVRRADVEEPFTVTVEPQLTGDVASTAHPIVAAVAEGSPAEQSGLQIGDLITAINGEPINEFEQLQAAVADNLGTEITLTVWREGETQDLTLTPRENPPEGQGAMGVAFANQTTALLDSNAGFVYLDGVPLEEIRPQSLGASFNYAFAQIGEVISLIAQLPGRIFAGTATAEEARPAGPVAIGQLGGWILQESAQNNRPGQLLQFIALVSISLGLTNLLPIPALDGGRILFVLIEIIRGKPIAPEREGMVHLVGLALLLSLMVVVTFNDIANPILDALR